jgi:hypothetical protein
MFPRWSAPGPWSTRTSGWSRRGSGSPSSRRALGSTGAGQPSREATSSLTAGWASRGGRSGVGLHDRSREGAPGPVATSADSRSTRGTIGICGVAPIDGLGAKAVVGFLQRSLRIRVSAGHGLAEADGNRTRLGALAPTPVLKTGGPTRCPDASASEDSGEAPMGTSLGHRRFVAVGSAVACASGSGRRPPIP